MRMTIRTDASDTIGAGHFTRCLALADRVAALGGRVAFLARQTHPVMAEALAERAHTVRLLNLPEGASPEDDARASGKALDTECDWLVVDHYGLDHRWETSLRGHARNVLVIDDLADRCHDCDILVDPGYGRDGADYSRLVPPHSELLVGTRFALLKHVFAQRHDGAPRRPERRRVHVFFGSGAAAMRWLAQYCEWLLDAFPNVLVCAVGHADRQAMRELVRRHAARLDWREQVDDMAAHMSTCDVAVGGPGSATWERACVGLASALVATAENQVPVLRALDGTGFCRFLGNAWELDAARFTAGVAAFLDDRSALDDMRARGVTAVDGCGVDRVVRRLAGQERADD